MKQEIQKQRKAPRFASQIWGLVSIVLAFVVLGVVTVYGLDIVSDTMATFTAGSVEETAANNTINAIAIIPSNLSNVSNIVMAGVVISVILAAFGGFAMYRATR